jgi:hypothetical protein
MRMIAWHGSPRTLRRRVWPAAYARALAVRWFELAADAGSSEAALRCSWCRTPMERGAVAGGGDPCCSIDCAEAVQVARLYLS